MNNQKLVDRANEILESAGYVIASFGLELEEKDCLIASLHSQLEANWISCSESLPKRDHLVAISWHGVDEVQCDYMDIDANYGTHFWANNQDDPPDNWFFIPSPPTGGK